MVRDECFIQMKGTNPWRSSACECTCVLTRIDHCLVTLSCLPCAFCLVPAYNFWCFFTGLVQLIFSFPSWFHTDSTALIRFIAFSQEQTAASQVVQIHTHVHCPRSKKWPTYHVAVPADFQRKFDLHLPPGRLVSFVAQINMWKVRCWVTDTQTQTYIQVL